MIYKDLDSILSQKEIREKQHLLIIVDEFFMSHQEQLESFGDVYFVQGGEKSKTLSFFSELLEKILKDQKVRRDSHLLAIGGGSVSDLGGFVASSLLRGISWSCIPTTLLAMVDAAIGGKTGINSRYGKNLIGSFHFPEKVYLCLDFLSTLPRVEYESGFGEILKYALLDQKIYRLLEEHAPFEEIVLACVQYKNKIVAEDAKESGRRALLNIGHTAGHALEKEYALAHGISVCIGLIWEDLALGGDKSSFLIKCIRDYKLEKIASIAREISGKNLEESCSYLYSDKKIKSNGLISLAEPFSEHREARIIQKDLKTFIENLVENLNKLKEILNHV